MLPLELLRLLGRQAGQLGIHVLPVTLLIIPTHPEPSKDSHKQDQRRRGKVEAAADGVVGRVVGQEGPGRHQAGDVAEKHADGDGHVAGRVGADVRAGLGVAEGPEDEGGAGHEKDGAVADVDVRVVGAEKDEVADHHGRGAGDHEDLSAVELPAGKAHDEEAAGTEGVRGHGEELLAGDARLLGE